MKKSFFVLTILFLGLQIFPEVVIPVKVLKKYDTLKALSNIRYKTEDVIFLNVWDKNTKRVNVWKVDIKTGDVLKSWKNSVFLTGTIENRMVVEHFMKARGTELYYWNPETDVEEAIPYDYAKGEIFYPPFLYYQNGIGFSEYPFGDGGFFPGEVDFI